MKRPNPAQLSEMNGPPHTMARDTDISNLFELYGGHPGKYHEIKYHELIEQVRSRWPLLQELKQSKQMDEP